ncbi:hypothetical protein [Algiphilus sp.]|uniref:hypothetical protein n=1 Tax=Algiphilus sp. TaxID=1872431 RepID=UPI003C574558
MAERQCKGWCRAASAGVGALVMVAAAAASTPAHAEQRSMYAAMAYNSGMLGVRLLLDDDRRGARLLDRAYAQGRMTGQPDPQSALLWYRRAAEAGYARAAYNAGAIFANGDLGTVDMDRAAVWMRTAADLEHEGARRWLERAEGYRCYC